MVNSAFAALILVLAAPASAAPPAPVPVNGHTEADTRALPPPALAEVDAFLREAVGRWGVPGLAVGIAHRGKLVFSKGYGLANLETGTPVTPETVFNIFSVTKTFTAAAVMQLVERKRLKLKDSVSRYLPDFPRGDEITIRQLLSHTSGLNDYSGSLPNAGRVGATPDELVALVANANKKFAFEPGTRWQYSNSNFVLLGRIIEIVGRASYRDYLARNVFEPAGLEHTAVDRNDDVVVGRATGYVARPGAPSGYENHYFDISLPFAAGAMRSNVPDLAKWFAAFFDGRIVSRSSVEAMSTTPARLKDGKLAGDAPADPSIAPGAAGYYGLGIRAYELDGHRAIGPGGSWNHFSAKVTNYPDDQVLIIVLANIGGQASQIEQGVAKIMLRRNSR